jgi:hypothetical protein
MEYFFKWEFVTFVTFVTFEGIVSLGVRFMLWRGMDRRSRASGSVRPRAHDRPQISLFMNFIS